jgi:hypothetical protein
MKCKYFLFFWLHVSTVKCSSDEDKCAYIKLYRSILSQVPNFKKTLESFGEDYESVMDLIKMVSNVIEFYNIHLLR